MNAVATAATLGGLYRLLVPEMVLGAVACVLFVGGTFRLGRNLAGAGALGALLGAGVAAALGPRPQAAASATVSPLLADDLALFVRFLALGAGGLLVLFSWHHVPQRWAAEYHGCLLLTIGGLALVGSANELVTLFLALELISIPSYVLLYLPRSDLPAQEAAAKYFFLSVFSSALLLFGFSYLYGLTGTTNVAAILEALARVPRLPLALSEGMPLTSQVALVMIVAGLGFKIAAVPFHFYAADVYQGAPLAGVALLAVVPKAAGFVALLRVLGFVWQGSISPSFGLGAQLGAQEVLSLFWIMAALTMTLGNVLALLQDNLKRMLAYSSVAHAGYMLIGLTVAPDLSLSGTDQLVGGPAAVLVYLVAYAAMTIGALAVLAQLGTPDRPAVDIHELEGLSLTHPRLALLMALFLFSLIGLPLTAGFVGKFLVFFGALAVPTPQFSEHAYWFRILALVGVVNAAVAAWYYLRVVGVMYLRPPVRPMAASGSLPGWAALLGCAALTLGLGVYPKPLIREAQRAAGSAAPPTAAVQAQR
ncbi:MAG: NADH-quinone oxidoreductase subunit N [Gemmataceae bacterium]|nr:NADH-quinone oxidoreductase subunit N [Gemmataceae bacterium]